jgi:hypothetical protein
MHTPTYGSVSTYFGLRYTLLKTCAWPLCSWCSWCHVDSPAGVACRCSGMQDRHGIRHQDLLDLLPCAGIKLWCRR